MPERAERGGRTFLDVTFVRCPACDKRAEVRERDGGLRLTCVHCGHNETIEKPRRHFESGSAMSLANYNSGQLPFNAPLWLETECCGGNRLWALNERHLDYLAAYVAEKQRARAFPSSPGYRQLATVLPKWMTLAKNRDEVLRAIERLRDTL